MSIVPVFYFLEGQVHKKSKLGIMANVGKNRLVKVIFTKIHNISDACANGFGRYIMIAMNTSFSGKMVFLRTLKLIYPSTPQHYKNYSAPTFLILFRKIVSPTPNLKKMAETMHSI